MIIQIKKYKKSGDVEIRNDVFDQLLPIVTASIKSILGRGKMYVTEGEVLSFAWDAFETGLAEYDCKGDLCTHFSNHACYYIKDKLRNEKRSNRKFKSLDEEVVNGIALDLAKNGTADQYSIADGLMTAREFVATLPEEYRLVFEDAVMSLDEIGNYRKKKNPGIKMPTTRYYEAKRVMRLVAKFLIAQP